MKIIDLSVPLEESPSELLPVEIVRLGHAETAEMMCGFFGCTKADLPEGLGWASDVLTLQSHSGTHLDAPWHYFPTSEGKKSKTIDEVPLEWCYGDGVVLDMRDKPRGSLITVEDLREALRKIDYQIKPGDIVLIMTGADRYWGKREYFDAGCGLGRESTLWILDHGVKVVGTDAWGWDRPFWAMKEEFHRTGDKSVIWAGHRAGIEREYCHIEKLANLDKIPVPFGFKITCFPVKLRSGSAGWSRVVAIVEEK